MRVPMRRVAALPYLLIGLGVLAMVASLGYGAAVGRSRRGPFFIAAPAVAAAVLLIERALVGAAGTWIYPVLWLTVNVIAVLALSLLWNLAGGVLDARQAKRLFPLLTSSAILGSFAGTLSAG